MNELMNVQKAQTLHAQIMSNHAIMAHALVNVCRDLKTMRDEALFTHLGFDTFEDYTEQMAKIRKRQAYAYISAYERLGAKFIEDNESLGITKLELVSQINAMDRQELMQETEVESLTVKELKAKIKKLQSRGEQLQLDIGELTAKNEEYEEQLSAVSIDNDKKLSALKAENAELRKAAKIAADAEPEIQEAIEKAKSKAKAQTKKLLAEKEKEYKDKLTELSSQSAGDKAELDRLRAELERARTEKNTRTAPDEELVQLKLVFSDLQLTANKVLDLLHRVGERDKPTAEKLSAVISDYLAKTADKVQQ